MVKDIRQYRPGLHKLLHNLDHLQKIRNGEIVSPIHVSVFPTNFCQLNCEYCCFKKTERTKEELSLEDFKMAVDVLTKYSLKALELSGGGEPLLWSYFNEAVLYAKEKGLKLSLVTNGLALEDISPEILSKFTWIRVSIQSEKYAEKIKIDHIPSTVKTSMSFIVHDEKSLRELQGIYKFAKKRDIVVRVAPIRPCSDDLELRVFEEVDRLGFPLISFQKEKGVPLGCYMLWLRAAIDWKGNFLPCPSIELSPEHFGKIPDDFGVCKISDLDEWLINTPVHDLGYRCSFCNCGKDTNDFIHNYFIKDVEDYEFV